MAYEVMIVHNQPVFLGKYTYSWPSIIPHKKESHTQLSDVMEGYPCNITIAWRYMSIKHEKQV